MCSSDLDHRIDLADRNRTDRVGSVGVRTTADARQLALALVGLAVVALVVALAALRLSVRSDDALLRELGARRRTLVAVGAVRGATLAAGATAVGAVVALFATALGLWWYDSRSRLHEEVVLAPIGWHVPPTAGLGLVVLVALAAAIGAVLTAVAPRSRTPRVTGATN